MDGYVDETLLKIYGFDNRNYHFFHAELVKFINGDGFFLLKEWPSHLKHMFFRRPLSDGETFQVTIFLIGIAFFIFYPFNYAIGGCPKIIIIRYIV